MLHAMNQMDFVSKCFIFDVQSVKENDTWKRLELMRR